MEQRRSPGRTGKSAATMRLPQLRLQRPLHVQHPSIVSAQEEGRDSIGSETSNSFLVETRRNRNIDASIRVNIEMRFRESIVNRTYVFPRETSPRKTSPSPLRKHATTMSYDSNARHPPQVQLPDSSHGLPLSHSRNSSSSKPKTLRLRAPNKSQRVISVPRVNRSASRSKSPYIGTSVSPLRHGLQSSGRRHRESGRLRPQQSLRALRLRGPSPYDLPSSRSTDRLVSLQ